MLERLHSQASVGRVRDSLCRFPGSVVLKHKNVVFRTPTATRFRRNKKISDASVSASSSHNEATPETPDQQQETEPFILSSDPESQQQLAAANSFSNMDLQAFWERLQVVEFEINQAVSVEDYRAAAKLKKEAEQLRAQLSPIQVYVSTKLEVLESGTMDEKLEAVGALWDAACTAALPAYLESRGQAAVKGIFEPIEDPAVRSMVAQFSKVIFNGKADALDAFAIFKRMAKVDTDHALMIGSLIRGRIERNEQGSEGTGTSGSDGWAKRAHQVTAESIQDLADLGKSTSSSGSSVTRYSNAQGLPDYLADQIVEWLKSARVDIDVVDVSQAGSSRMPSIDVPNTIIPNSIAPGLTAADGRSAQQPEAMMDTYNKLLTGSRQDKVDAMAALWTYSSQQSLSPDFQLLAQAALRAAFSPPASAAAESLLLAFCSCVVDASRSTDDAVAIYYKTTECDLTNAIVMGQVLCKRLGVSLPRPPPSTSTSGQPDGEPQLADEMGAAPAAVQRTSAQASTSSPSPPPAGPLKNFGNALASMAGFMRGLVPWSEEQQQSPRPQQLPGAAATAGPAVAPPPSEGTALAASRARGGRGGLSPPPSPQKQQQQPPHQHQQRVVSMNGWDLVQSVVDSERAEQREPVVEMIELDLERLVARLLPDSATSTRELAQLLVNALDLGLVQVQPEVIEKLMAAAQAQSDDIGERAERSETAESEGSALHTVDSQERELKWMGLLSTVQNSVNSFDERLAALTRVWEGACRGEVPTYMRAMIEKATFTMFQDRQEPQVQALVSEFVELMWDPLRPMDEAVHLYDQLQQLDSENSFVMGSILEAVLEVHIRRIAVQQSEKQIGEMLERSNSAEAGMSASAGTARRRRSPRSRRRRTRRRTQDSDDGSGDQDE